VAERKLTLKQVRFVEEYLVDLNATQAAIRAGYSARNADKIGPRLVGNRRVRQAIMDAQQSRSQQTALTAEWVLDRLREEAQRTDKSGSPTARVAALKLLGQHVGLWRDKALEELQRELDDLKRLIAESHAPDGASCT
jgi:phage terminase small subunit